MRIRPCLRSSLLLAVCFSASAVLASGTARAQDEASTEDTPTDDASAPAPAHAHTKKTDGGSTWYGWQTLLVDGASIVTLVVAGSSQSEGLFALSGATHVLGAPIVHAAHGRPGAFGGSLGLRAGLPFVAAVIGAATAGPCHPPASGPASEEACNGPISSQVGGAVVGGGVGILIAMAIDAAALAHESSPDAEADGDDGGEGEGAHPHTTRRRATLSLAPSVAPIRGGAVGGVSGVF